MESNMKLAAKTVSKNTKVMTENKFKISNKENKETRKTTKRENSDNPKEDKLQKKKMTMEERVWMKGLYDEYVSPYPKGQLCTYYLRGCCWLFENCQFAHGVKNLDLKMYLTFCEDKKSNKVRKEDLVLNIQKQYLITKRDYRNLFDFQEENKERVSNYYTYEQLNADSRKRIELRRIFHNAEFEHFCHLIFSLHSSLSVETFQYFLDSMGFVYNYHYFQGKHLLSKSVINKSCNKKQSLIKLMPKEEDILLTFIEIITNDIEANWSEHIFPLSFKYVNGVVNKLAGFEDPLIHHYLKLLNITQSEFMEVLVDNPNFMSKCETLFEKKGKKLPPREERIYSQNITEILCEVKDTFWGKLFNSKTSQESNYAIVKFDFLKTNYVNKIVEHKHSMINEGVLTFLVKKVINHNKDLFFMNNNYIQYIINPLHFNNHNLNIFFESEFETRCEVKSTLGIYDILSNLMDNENENQHEQLTNLIINLYFENTVTNDNTKSDFTKLNIKNEILIIDDFNSLLYLVEKSKTFKIVAVDLEGSLNKEECKVDLIQLCDPETELIFVIDVYSISNCDSNCDLFKSLKIFLTFLFENNKFAKIFHDGRNDVLALHTFFGICPSNYLDTACLFSAIKQFKLQIEFFNKHLSKVKLEDLVSLDSEGMKNLDTDFNNLYSFLYNSVNPGINKVLENYEPEQRINHLKDKMHELFGKENSRDEYFLKRPIEEEFLIYSALDVKYLPAAMTNLRSDLQITLKGFYGDNTIKYSEIIMRVLSNDHMKCNCKYTLFNNI